MNRQQRKKKKDGEATGGRAPILSSSADGLHTDLISPDHLRRSEIDTLPSSKFLGRNLSERNQIVLDAARNIFDLRFGNWNQIKRTISAEQIQQFYDLIGEVWHPKGEYYETLPIPSSDLKAIYSGSIEIPDLTTNIFRFQLYTDTIFVPDPFQVPHAIKDEFSPILNPAIWKADTLKNLYFLLNMEPWIEAGSVQLIPDPNDFDHSFRITSRECALKRLRNYTPSKVEIEETTEPSKVDFRRQLFELPREFWMKAAKKLNLLSSPESEEELWQFVLDQRNADPLALELSETELNHQLRASHGGFNLETTLLLSDHLGAFPYTNLKMRWREFKSVRPKLSDEARIWSPLSEAFRELDFKFLDQVDSRFAFEMRTEQRLQSFRSYLRRLWIALNSPTDPAESLVREFRDELADEYAKATADWRAIDTDLISWLGKTTPAAIVGMGAGSLVSGNLSWVPPVASAVGFVASSVFKLIESSRKRTEFRLKNPMSVFVDLANT